MIEIWMKDHLVCDNNSNIVNLLCSRLFSYKEWQMMLGFTFSASDTPRAVYN